MRREQRIVLSFFILQPEAERVAEPFEFQRIEAFQPDVVPAQREQRADHDGRYCGGKEQAVPILRAPAPASGPNGTFSRIFNPGQPGAGGDDGQNPAEIDQVAVDNRHR